MSTRAWNRASRGSRSPIHRPLSMTPRARTLGVLLDDLARAQPGAEAVVSRDDRVTYAALRARVDDVARALLALGVRRGDRVALLLPNRPEWLITAFAAAKIGAPLVAISTFSTPREIAWTLEHARPRVVVTMEAFRGRTYLGAIHDMCPELATATPGALRSVRLPDLTAVITIDERRHDGALRWAELSRRGRPPCPARRWRTRRRRSGPPTWPSSSIPQAPRRPRRA